MTGAQTEGARIAEAAGAELAGVGAIETVLGPVPAGEVGAVLAAETLLSRPGPSPKGASIPARDAAFEREPVTMRILGRLLMGAPNRDDRTLEPADAGAALALLAEAEAERAGSGGSSRVAGRTVVVALAGSGSDATAAELAELSRASGVAIVRGAIPGAAREGGGDEDPGAGPGAGVVGLVPSDDPAGVAAAAVRAARTGLALALGAGSDPERAARALEAVEAAGLARERVILVGAQRALGRRLGVEPGRLEALLGLGTALCFDGLGRIPTVRTVVSDHDVAAAILRCAELGAGDRVLLSCGIRSKHRLTAFGGNGLEFVATQFLPYLAALGADEELVAAVRGRNAARLLARSAARVPGAAARAPGAAEAAA